MLSLGFRFILFLAILGTLRAQTVPPPELKPIKHQVLFDERTYLRAADDRRYSIWSDDPATSFQILEPFKLDFDFEMVKGQIVAVFFNDRITEDLTKIVYNKSANEIFADYADSGIMFKLAAPPAGKKYSHVTVVVFTPPQVPGHLGMRAMVQDGLSEKKP